MRHGRTRAPRAAGMRFLARLGIRGKLNLLLLPPLVAVLLVSVPFVLTEATNAKADAQVARTARQAQQLGGLVWQLQRERLVTSAYVGSVSVSRDDVVAQQKTVDDTVKSVQAGLGASAPDELTAAVTRIGSLDPIRGNALLRAVPLDSIARTYHAVIDAVIDALRLVPQGSDAEGTRELTALDALLRANEENSLRGVALIVRAVAPDAGQSILDEANQQAPLFLERFVQQADDSADHQQASLVVDVEQGDTGRTLNGYAGEPPNSADPFAVASYVENVLVAADSQAGQRKIVQERVIGDITDAAAGRATSTTDLAWAVGLGAGLLFALVALLAIAVSRSIADPLRRLTAAATSVADLADSELVRVTDTEEAQEQAPRLVTIDVAGGAELGRLAEAFNRVQSTAGELVERQALTRRNTSAMFANVAKRTQNLVGRQLALVDELERNEQDVRLLASLYRLDHLSTRLRRNADNLLVVSGSRDEGRITGPVELSVALRSALAEIEDYQRVRLGAVDEVRLASSIGSDLVLLFAELLENATAFSPPGSMVEVDTMRLADGDCVVAIVDHGIGMAGDRLAEENRRLVERERLELAPTSVLGLFVVGRLARRHELDVELRTTPTTGGVTVRVRIPANLVGTGADAPPPRAEPKAAPPVPSPRRRPEPEGKPAERSSAIPALFSGQDTGIGDFRWFRQQHLIQPEWPEAEPDVPATRESTVDVHGGLRRRVRGAQLPSTGVSLPPTVELPLQDPNAVKDAMDGFQDAFTKAAEPGPGGLHKRRPGASLPDPAVARAPAPEPAEPRRTPGKPAQTSRGGLRRRVRGAQLPDTSLAKPAPETAQQDPSAVKNAMDGFQDAFTKAAEVFTPTPANGTPLLGTREPAPSRGGIPRRVPGAQLAPGLRGQAQPRPLARNAAGRSRRDPAAERAVFDAFAAGLARADVSTADTTAPPAAVAGRDQQQGEKSTP